MNGSAFLSLALQLQNAHDEARLRTAVSRAYYGVLHIAAELVEEFGVVLPKTASLHEKIPKLFQNSGDEKAKTLGHFLDNLRRERNNADYQIDNPKFSDAHFAKINVARAQKCAELLLDCSCAPARDSVRNGIRKHAKDVERMQLVD